MATSQKEPTLLERLDAEIPIDGRPGPDWVSAREAAGVFGCAETTIRKKLKDMDAECRRCVLVRTPVELFHIPGIAERMKF